MTAYSYTKILHLPFDEAVERTVEALRDAGFGILTDIDVQKTLKEKLGKDFTRYRILGACNPSRAFTALEAEEEIGLLLPCNVIVYEKQDGVAISVLRPTVAFSFVQNDALEPIAKEVEEILKKVLDEL